MADDVFVEIFDVRIIALSHSLSLSLSLCVCVDLSLSLSVDLSLFSVFVFCVQAISLSVSSWFPWACLKQGRLGRLQVAKDPGQLKNLVNETSQADLDYYRATTLKQWKCAGSQCL